MCLGRELWSLVSSWDEAEGWYGVGGWGWGWLPILLVQMWGFVMEVWELVYWIQKFESKGGCELYIYFLPQSIPWLLAKLH